MLDNKENCPDCNADLQGELIPIEQQKNFGATHFSRKLGVYDIKKDRTICWQCPDCNHQWKR